MQETNAPVDSVASTPQPSQSPVRRAATDARSAGRLVMVVLDAVHRVQAEQASDLAVRWNCKAGKCGSCSAEINGVPRLMTMKRMLDGRTLKLPTDGVDCWAAEAACARIAAALSARAMVLIGSFIEVCLGGSNGTEAKVRARMRNHAREICEFSSTDSVC